MDKTEELIKFRDGLQKNNLQDVVIGWKGEMNGKWNNKI